MTQQMTTLNSNNKKLLDMYLNMLVPPAVHGASSNEMKCDHDHIDQFYARKRKDHASESPDEQIPAQERIRAQRPVLDTFQCDRDQRGNDQGVKDDR